VAEQRQLVAFERGRRPGDRRQFLGRCKPGEQLFFPNCALQLPYAEADQNGDRSGYDNRRNER
jgi:hypothetical protein